MPDPILTTLAKLKTHLSISDSSENALLTQLLLELDEVIASWTGRAKVPGRNPFESVAASEYYDGTGRNTLLLRRRPVTAVESVIVDASGAYGHGPNAFETANAPGTFATGRLLTLGTQYAPSSTDATEDNGGLLHRIGGYCWPEGQGNIKVTYTAGYVMIPVDLELAVHQLAAAVREGAQHGGIVGGETLGRYSYRLLEGTADGGLMVATARATLARYKECSL